MHRRAVCFMFFTCALATPLLAQPGEKPRVLELQNPAPAPEFAGIQTWLNSPPLKMSDLKGKAVALVFFAYS